MKKAFLMSFILHAVVVLAFIGITTLTFKEIKHNIPMQLSMEIIGDSNVGRGNTAKGVEDSKSNVDVNKQANSSKDTKKSDTKPEEEKISKKEVSKLKPEKVKKDSFVENNKKEKKKEEKKKEEKKIVKKDNVTENKDIKESDTTTAIMAAQGKSQGDSIGNTQEEGRGKSAGGLDGVYTLKEVDDKPKLVNHVKPSYPKEAFNMRIEGSVRVMFSVNEKGEVVNPKIVKSNPPDVFEKAALNAVKQWKFKPGKKNGEIVNVRMVVPINFTIDRN